MPGILTHQAIFIVQSHSFDHITVWFVLACVGMNVLWKCVTALGKESFPSLFVKSKLDVKHLFSDLVGFF